jgi:hypothetical protein
MPMILFTYTEYKEHHKIFDHLIFCILLETEIIASI